MSRTRAAVPALCLLVLAVASPPRASGAWTGPSRLRASKSCLQGGDSELARLGQRLHRRKVAFLGEREAVFVMHFLLQRRPLGVGVDHLQEMAVQRSRGVGRCPANSARSRSGLRGRDSPKAGRGLANVPTKAICTWKDEASGNHDLVA
jgi:hypothetical protein